MSIFDATMPRLPFEVGRTDVTSTSAWIGVADPHRLQHLLVQLQHGEAGALDHALAQQPLDQAVGQRRRHEAALDRALLGAERVVGEDHLDHAGDADEHHQVGLGHGAVERAEFLPGRKLLPGEAQAQRLHLPRHHATFSLPPGSTTPPLAASASISSGRMPISCKISRPCSPRSRRQPVDRRRRIGKPHRHVRHHQLALGRMRHALEEADRVADADRRSPRPASSPARPGFPACRTS